MVPPNKTNWETREDILSLSRTLKTNVNRRIKPRVNIFESTMTFILRDIVINNPPIFLGCIVGEDPQGFLNGVYMVLNTMRVTSSEKALLFS